MSGTAADIVHNDPSSDHEREALDDMMPLYLDYSQNDLEHYPAQPNDVNQQPFAEPRAWQGAPPLTSCYDVAARFGTAPVWQGYGSAPTNHNSWDGLADGSPGFGPYRQVWPLSPSETISNNPWSPADQPLPSPHSEVPSYFAIQNPLADNEFSGGRASPATDPNHSLESASWPSPSTNTSTLPTPVPKPPKTRGKSNAPSRRASNPKSTPKSPRPKTLKRRRSDTPSVASTSTAAVSPTHSNTSASTSPSATTMATTTTTAAQTTLGGVLPANVDPRIASEQIRREAWQRCRAEAHQQMALRQMLLLGDADGALEREAESLRTNLASLGVAMTQRASECQAPSRGHGQARGGAAAARRREEAAEGKGPARKGKGGLLN